MTRQENDLGDRQAVEGTAQTAGTRLSLELLAVLSRSIGAEEEYKEFQQIWSIIIIARTDLRSVYVLAQQTYSW